MTKKKLTQTKKIFVLDTSVILYNHHAIRSFKDNDVVIPITVLEELDNFKTGHDHKNYEAREFIRIIDNLAKEHNSLQEWVPIDNESGGRVKVEMNKEGGEKVAKIFGRYKPDHNILGIAMHLHIEYPNQKIVVVTKDINLRIKAKALNLSAEDFETGKIKDVDSLTAGNSMLSNVNPDVIDKIYKDGFCEASDLDIEDPISNHYYVIQNCNKSVLAYYNPITKRIEHIIKRAAHRITPRNVEQIFALHAIMNQDVKLLSIQGISGTGKTLLALAGALDQRKKYKQVYLARPIVPLSNKNIGYLPGDIKMKLNPYMEPLFDNLKFIKSQYHEKDKELHNINDLLEKEKLVIAPLAYIRGRSLSNICFIVDEAQNLTPHEVKTIITRAGENTKIIFTGDIHQIDTPYLDSQSNGLSYLIHKINNHPIVAHIKLIKGERSELANLAGKLL